MEIPVDLIDVDLDWNCREKMEDIDKLAISISSIGLLQPLTVWARDGRYKLIAGFRRYQALTELEWDEIPVVVADVDNEFDAKCINLIENTERSNLTFYEEARALEPMWVEGLARETIAGKLNKSPGWVQWRVQMIDLCNHSPIIDLWTKEGAFTQEEVRKMFTILTHFDVATAEIFAKKLKGGEKPSMPVIPGKVDSKKALTRPQIQDAMSNIMAVYGRGPHSYALAFASGEIDITAFCASMDEFIHYCPSCAECIEPTDFHAGNRV